MATFAPSAASRFAIAAPIPREPPVMRAIFPSSFLDIFLLLVSWRSLPHTSPGSACRAWPRFPDGWLCSVRQSDAELLQGGIDFLRWRTCLAGMGMVMGVRHLLDTSECLKCPNSK